MLLIEKVTDPLEGVFSDLLDKCGELGVVLRGVAAWMFLDSGSEICGTLREKLIELFQVGVHLWDRQHHQFKLTI